jgi:hypothetical protein
MLHCAGSRPLGTWCWVRTSSAPRPKSQSEKRPAAQTAQTIFGPARDARTCPPSAKSMKPSVLPCQRRAAQCGSAYKVVAHGRVKVRMWDRQSHGGSARPATQRPGLTAPRRAAAQRSAKFEDVRLIDHVAYSVVCSEASRRLKSLWMVNQRPTSANRADHFHQRSAALS